MEMVPSGVAWRAVPDDLARALLEFANHRNLGKTLEVEGATYVLDYISRSSSSFHVSRGLSVYYRTKRSVIRISDHWTASRGFPRSRKLNCGPIDRYWWYVKNRPGESISFAGLGAGKYPFRMIAGIAGLAVLNKSCPHWRNGVNAAKEAE